MEIINALKYAEGINGYVYFHDFVLKKAACVPTGQYYRYVAVVA